MSTLQDVKKIVNLAPKLFVSLWLSQCLGGGTGLTKSGLHGVSTPLTVPLRVPPDGGRCISGGIGSGIARLRRGA